MKRFALCAILLAFVCAGNAFAQDAKKSVKKAAPKASTSAKTKAPAQAAAAAPAELKSTKHAKNMGDAVGATVGSAIVLPVAAVVVPTVAATDVIYQGVATTGNTVKEVFTGERTINPLKANQEFQLVEPHVDGNAAKASR